MEYDSAVKRDEVLRRAAMWMDPENKSFSEQSQIRKDTAYESIAKKCPEPEIRRQRVE